MQPLKEGDRVWTTDCKKYGLVVGKSDTPRSYFVQTLDGRLRRNRRHLVSIHGSILPLTLNLPEWPDNDSQDENTQLPVVPVSQDQYVTRSGRISKLPDRFIP